MEQILLAYGLSKETVAAIAILYKNTKVKVRSPDGDTDYFDIVAGVLQGDTLALYLFIICLDYVLRTSIDKTASLQIATQNKLIRTNYIKCKLCGDRDETINHMNSECSQLAQK